MKPILILPKAIHSNSRYSYLKLILVMMLFLVHLSSTAQIDPKFKQVPPPDGKIQAVSPFIQVKNSTYNEGDVDGDGDLDILISGRNNTSQSFTKLYLNDGLGVFSEHPESNLPSTASTLIDIDADGKYEILAASSNSPVKIYEYSTSGQLIEKTGSGFGNYIHAGITPVDIDNDSDIDIIYSGRDPSNNIVPLIYLNDGTGMFTWVGINAFPGNNLNSIVFGDIDNDNDPDALVSVTNTSTSTFNSTTKLFTNNGSGTFTELTTSTFVSGTSGSYFDFADIDNDNDLDIGIIGQNSNQLKLYKNDGTGVFTEESSSGLTPVNNGTIDFADIDGDNDVDLFVTGFTQPLTPSSASSSLYTNDGSGNFTLVTSGIKAQDTGATLFTDADGDGDFDLLSGGGSFFPSTKLYENDGSGGLDIVSGSPFSAASSGSFLSFDKDGDGDQDLIQKEGYNTHLYELSAGVYTKTSTPSTFAAISGVVKKADIDGDGDEDVLITGQTGQSGGMTGPPVYTFDAKMYLNDGSGNLSVIAGTPFTGISSGDAEFADIDGDGDEDLLYIGATAAFNTYTAELYTNNGSGSYTLVTGTPFLSASQTKIKFFDPDGDGDLDLLYQGSTGNASHTKYYLNNGSGTFTEAATNPFLQLQGGSISIEDIDNDGDKDVLLCGYDRGSFQNKMALYLNNGSGVFTHITTTPFNTLTARNSVFMDIDGDGDKDIMATGPSSLQEAKLYYNDGLGVFTEVTGPLLYGTSEPLVFDYDGNSKEDVIMIGGIDAPLLYKNISCNSPAVPTGTASQTLDYFETVSDIAVTGQGIRWYSSAQSSTPLGPQSTLADNQTYYATQTVAGCESTDRLAVTVALNYPTLLISGTGGNVNTNQVLNVSYTTSGNFKPSSIFEVVITGSFEGLGATVASQVITSPGSGSITVPVLAPNQEYFVKIVTDDNLVVSQNALSIYTLANPSNSNLWEELSGSVQNQLTSGIENGTTMGMIEDINGNPIVALKTAEGVQAKIFRNNAWEPNSLNIVSNDIESVKLTTGNNGEVYLLVSDGQNQQINIKKWDGDFWISYLNLTGEFHPGVDFGFDSNNDPTLSYYKSNTTIESKKYVNNTWQAMPDLVLNNISQNSIDIKRNAAGNLYLGFQTNNLSPRFNLYSLNNLQWQLVSTSTLPNATESYFGFLQNSNPILFLLNSGQNLSLHEYSSGTWTPASLQGIPTNYVNLDFKVNSQNEIILGMIQSQTVSPFNQLTRTFKRNSLGWVETTGNLSGETDWQTPFITKNGFFTASNIKNVRKLGQNSWGFVGDNGLGNYKIGGDFAIDQSPSGKMMAAFTASSSIKVKEFKNDAWQDVSSAGLPLSFTGKLSLAIDENGKAYLAANNQVYSFDGYSWSTVGSVLYCSSMILKLNDSNELFAAYEVAGHPNVGPNGTFWVSSWNGTSWTGVGGGGIGPLGGNSYDMAFDENGNPVVIGSYQYVGTYIKKWDGSAWVSLPTNPSFSSFTAVTSPKLSVDASGVISVGINEGSNTSNGLARIYQYNGTAWSELGAGLGDASSIFENIAHSPSDELFVLVNGDTFSQNGQVLKWSGSSWDIVADNTISEGYEDFDFTFDQSGNPYVIGAASNVMSWRYLNNPTIETTVAVEQIVPNTTLPVTFETDGSFDSGNQFTVELSDENGDFTNPTATATGTGSPIDLQIPGAGTSGNKDENGNETKGILTTGTGYKIRVVSSVPPVNGTEVPVVPNIPVLTVGVAELCNGDDYTLSASCPGNTVQWFEANGTTPVSNLVLTNLTANVTYKVQCETTTLPTSTSEQVTFTIKVSSVHPDIEALKQLYNVSSGATWTNSENWLSDCDPCGANSGQAWYGISCENNRVTGIDLSSNGLTGSFTVPLFYQLTALKTLNLSDNTLSGGIPSQLGLLSNLFSLDLNQNQLTGTIPSSFTGLTLLEGLDVSHNSLNGIIPHLLSQINGIESLYLDNNQFTGSVPTWLTSLSDLRNLSLSSNSLSGCYSQSLNGLCAQLENANNASMSDGPSMSLDATWGNFCSTGAGACPCANEVVLQSTADDYSTGTIIKEAGITNGEIEATNKITGNAKVTYKAGRNIQLKPGFKADNGTVFTAEMGGCVE